MSYISKVFFLLIPSVGFADSVAVAASEPNPMSQWILLGSFLLVFYFLMWRPQAKRAKAHQALVSSLAKGDEVLTAGGLLGVVSKVGEQYLTITIADGVDIRVQKQSVTSMMPKGTVQSV